MHKLLHKVIDSCVDIQMWLYAALFIDNFAVWLDSSALCCLQWSSGDAAGASGEVQL